jgi:V/A-type H+-transporting ATPase subunit A
MLKLVITFHAEAERALKAGVYLKTILEMTVRDKIARAKYISETEMSKIDDIYKELSEQVEKLIAEGGVVSA